MPEARVVELSTSDVILVTDGGKYVGALPRAGSPMCVRGVAASEDGSHRRAAISTDVLVVLEADGTFREAVVRSGSAKVAVCDIRQEVPGLSPENSAVHSAVVELRRALRSTGSDKWA